MSGGPAGRPVGLRCSADGLGDAFGVRLLYEPQQTAYPDQGGTIEPSAPRTQGEFCRCGW